MYKGLCGIVCAVAVTSSSAQAENAAQSDQIMACHQKVVQLSEQTRPLKTKLNTLRTERKGVSASGGEVARFKLSNLDQEISQLAKQIDGINTQVATETKHCDDLSNKPKTPAAAQAPATPAAGTKSKNRH